MKISFVYDAVYPWEKGGAQKRVWELARRLSDDHEVHMYGMYYWDGPRKIEKEGVILHGVCRPYELYSDGRRAIPPAIKFAAKLAPALLKENFDIIDCQQFPYFPVFTTKAHELLRSSSLVVTWYEVWGDYWYDYLGLRGSLGKFIERLAVQLPHTIIPISSFILEDLQNVGRSANMTVVENGVDFHGIQDITPTRDSWDLIYVGRLSEHKRVNWLLDAISLASRQIGAPIETCIIGDGPERSRLETRALNLDIHRQVDFKGFIESDKEVIGMMKSSKAFVLPSIREGFPNTILEANACGKPAIIVDHPENGSKAVVEDGTTGIVTQPKPKSIAKSITQILGDDEVYQHLSKNALEFGREHDWEIIVDDLEQAYSKALRHNINSIPQ